MLRSPEEVFMALAIQEAEDGLAEGEAPVGAAILDAETGRILARAHQQTKALRDPTAHAVMIALTQLAEPAEEGGQPASAKAMILATTREPCLMCAGAILQYTTIRRVLIGAPDEAEGAFGSQLDVLKHLPRNRTIELVKGVLSEHCERLWRRRGNSG
jgi:tRNA(adenine34) deaminase